MGIQIRASWLLLTASVALGAGGCGSSNSTGGASMGQLASAASAQRDVEEQKAKEQAEADRKAQAAAQAAAVPTMKKAGRPKIEPGGYFRAIIGARRKILNETDRWPWIQAVQHFQATEGRMPKDHDEFMNRIVIPLEINLGYKEPYEEFFYDPNEGDFGELYVVTVREPQRPKDSKK
jgi:hypothetical protein